MKKNNFFRILIKKIWGICEKLTKNMKNVKLAYKKILALGKYYIGVIKKKMTLFFYNFKILVSFGVFYV